MANGFHGTDKQWERIVKPLRELDPILEEFGLEKALELGKNVKNWPNREFRWKNDLERLIEIFLESEKHLSWTLWVCAYEDRYKDRTSNRHWRRRTLAKAVSIDFMLENLPNLLEEGWLDVTAWTSNDLESAG
jgi:hypothetical protein